MVEMQVFSQHPHYYVLYWVHVIKGGVTISSLFPESAKYGPAALCLLTLQSGPPLSIHLLSFPHLTKFIIMNLRRYYQLFKTNNPGPAAV